VHQWSRAPTWVHWGAGVREAVRSKPGCVNVHLKGWLRPAPPQALEGTDRFAGADATVLDYWRWAFSDLRDNTQRGVLAEFLVALALAVGFLRRSC
jgi:hypothetical protein